jgi:hypothetical protein
VSCWASGRGQHKQRKGIKKTIKKQQTCRKKSKGWEKKWHRSRKSLLGFFAIFSFEEK